MSYWLYTCSVFILAVSLLLWIYFSSNSDKIVTTYCINLPDEHQRRRHIQRHFSSLRIRFIDAVDTRDDRWRLYTDHLTDEAIRIMENNLRAGRREHHHELTPGAIGCFLSHLKCYHTFLKNGSGDILLVLEDDSIPNPDFIPTLQNILEDLPEDADLILLSHLFNGIKEPTRHTALDLASRDSSFFLTNCYLITRNGIQQIVDHQKAHHDKFDCQIDAYLSTLVQQGILKLYLTKDVLCPQSNHQFLTSIQTLSVG